MIDSATKQKIFGTPETTFMNHAKGFASWAFTLDHKRIGIMYLIGVTLALFLAGIFALVLRSHLFTFDGTMLTPAQYNQMFTLHGAVMVFAFIIPSVPAALGNIVLPMMIGAKDVAFPRMNLMSFYLWIIGTGCLLCAILFAGGLDTGWTFYTPYSIDTDTGVIWATFGAFVLGFSSIFTGLNFLVTVNTMRAKGQTWFKLPLFLWSLYATSIIQILATPVLGITLLLLIAEKTMHVGIFDPAYGGDPVLFQHFFWFYSHPAVYIMILPAMGVISELISVYSQKRIFGYSFIAFSSVAIALLGFLVWGHHMFTSGQSQVLTLIFSAITFTVAIPSAVKVFNWLATLYKGSILLNTPMCYALSFIFLFGIGGLTGLFLGALSTDIHLHDTYFVVAHFHFVMVGGNLDRLAGWFVSLVAQNIRANVQRPAGPNLLFPGLFGLQPDILSSVCHGLSRNASTIRFVRSRIFVLPSNLDRWCICAWLWHPGSILGPGLRGLQGTKMWSQPVPGSFAGMANQFAT